MRALIVILLTSLAIGCGAKTAPIVTEVQVPVEVRSVPPAELLKPIETVIPTFIEPSADGASSALSVEDERLLRALINDLITRIKAWEAWGNTQVKE